MQIKTILLAATSLLALAGATASDPHTDTKIGASAPDVFDVEANALLTRAPDQCFVMCHAPWLKCSRDCGGTDQCNDKCACELFSDPKQMCRVRRCVPPPHDCSHRADIQGRSEDIETVDDESSDTTGAPALSQGSCILCVLNGHRCTADCENDPNSPFRHFPGACENACKCCFAGTDDCKTCNVTCYSKQAVAQSSPVKLTDEMEATPKEVQGLDNESSSSSSAGVEIPVPPRPCDICQFAINRCIGGCESDPNNPLRPFPGACKNACNCYYKSTNSCKECKIPCKSQKADDSLTPVERRQEPEANINAEAVSDADDKLNTAISPPPIPNPPCLQCTSARGSCKKACATRGACDDTCDCWHKKHNKNCKDCNRISCDCGHTCPRLSALQRRTSVHAATADVHDTNNQDAQSEATELVPNPCVVCRTGIMACKNYCKGDCECENACDCYFKSHTPNCKECDITCKRKASRQTKAPGRHDTCSNIPWIVPVPPYILPSFEPCP